VESHGGDGIDRAKVQDKATCPDCWYVFGALGIYPQKPIKKAYEQRPVEVKAWLDNSYPVIAERAKAEGAEIHWEMKLDCAAMTCADVLSHPKENTRGAGQQ